MTIPTPVPGLGYLTPASTNSELNDQGLDRLLQQFVVGITALPANLVWPRWQPEPPNQPDFGIDWAAVGVIDSDPELFAAVLHSSPLTGSPVDTVIRNEIIEALVSFYGPNAQANAKLFTNGVSEAQNREVLYLNGFGLVEVRKGSKVPVLWKDRWMPGWDVPFRLRRQEQYQYQVPNLVEADATLRTDVPAITRNIVAK